MPDTDLIVQSSKVPAGQSKVSAKEAGKTEESGQHWWIYMILAADQSIYTGISTDPERRFQQHLTGKGARFFRGRKPLRFLFQEAGHTRTSASQREYQIKQLSRSQKLALAASSDGCVSSLQS